LLFKSLLFFFFLSVSIHADKPKLLFYCGATMVRPMLDIAKVIEEQYHCKISIIQGGSRDLFESLKIAKKGDLFLLGNSDYIDKYDKEGYFGYRKCVGYNQLAIFVQKGNPYHVKSLDDLTRKDLLVSIGNPETSSMGIDAEETLMRYKGKEFLQKIQYNIASYAADSRDMNHMFAIAQTELGLNWIATSYFQKNKAFIDVIPIFELYAPPKELIITVLKYSKYPNIAKAFVEYTTSLEGQKIMKKYGFMRNE